MEYTSSDENFIFHPLPVQEYPGAIGTGMIQSIFAHCADFELRRIAFGLEGRVSLSVCWLDGTVSGGSVSEDILRPLTDFARSLGAADEESVFALIRAGAVYSYSVKPRRELSELVGDLTHGHCAVIFDALQTALCFEVRTEKTRSVSEPTLEKSLKGGKDSFVETLRVNTALVRRRLSTPKLKVIESTIGRRSATRVGLLYLDGVASPEVVEELARRLDALDIDALLATGLLEEALSNAPHSPFPQFIHTERPDRFAMYLSDGRVGLLIDGIPVGLVAPVSFDEFMRVIGDSNMHWLVASGITLLRYGALLIALLLPALYVAISMYHPEMIPRGLLLSVIEAKQDVPFSTALEVLGMLLAFAFLQEAGLRLPNPIGDTVSIIGALIVGQSAVDASLVSPIAIIVVALSGIACYTLPSQDLGFAIRLCRSLLLFGAIFAGLFGVAAASCLVLLHLACLDSFGVDYTSPLSDEYPLGLLRLLVTPPKRSVKFRPPELKTPDRRRQR